MAFSFSDYSSLLPFLFSFFLSIFRSCPKADPRFVPLVQRVTQNFDTFEDYGSAMDNEGKIRVQKTAALDQFYNYEFRRVRKPRIPLPGMPE